MMPVNSRYMAAHSVAPEGSESCGQNARPRLSLGRRPQFERKRHDRGHDRLELPRALKPSEDSLAGRGEAYGSGTRRQCETSPVVDPDGPTCAMLITPGR